ncbi:branched-chain amino acid aminotransferase [Corynebacterium bovis]|uniref:branched-chain-amino-acid transaminase n=1 Tax=Corynebacterium bovis TaxID=36808 RepID=A0A426PZK2_9CORY|nr:branched-chain amino acid aminotransferase [Corynebacterium bovis]MDN8578524.1 branched-chain amino acid aminotransferase [Corynebacterium bovis]RRO86983.1 branched chain amino acid aminotransferase [Corynebacterium bovis]RRO89930.1 branched chain amino acid aminotransferase [Corynebacterium bovis]
MSTASSPSAPSSASPAPAPSFAVTLNPDPTSPEERERILADPGFGRYMTDHMAVIDWNEEEGWHDARIVPYGPLTLDPATSVLHYGQAIFEGLKVYRQPDGSLATFRPDRNADRMRSSARRLAMPELPDDLFLGAVRGLVDVDRDWVPAAGGEEALYIRPVMISRGTGLGVHPSSEYTFYVIASPAGAYFSGGINPVSVWLSTDYVRAAPGGTGAAKCAGNYAASLAAQREAEEQGCDQVVWLDAVERKWIEEMGGMNLAFVFGRGDNAELITPELSGSLLPGVTRASLLQVARDLGMNVVERRISAEEWEQAAGNGELSEVFACGTAAVITPVGTVRYPGGEFTVDDGRTGEVTMRLRSILTGIQRGTVEDAHGWMHTLIPAGEA